MPRKRSVSRKKKAPTKTDNDENLEEEQRDTTSSSSSSEENNKESVVEEEADMENSKQADDNTMIDEDGASTANNTSVAVLDPNDHDLSSGDEGKEDEINHPTTTSPLFRRRPSLANKSNNNRQSSSPSEETNTTSPSSPSTLQTNHSPSKTMSSSTTTITPSLESNVTESEGNNHNSQDVLIKKTRATRRKPLQSPITKKQDDNTTTSTTTSDEDKTTIEQPESSSESSSTSTAATDGTSTIPVEDSNTNNQMEDDDAFLTHKSDYDSDEVVIETPKKSRVKKRGRTPLPKSASTMNSTDEAKSTEESTNTTTTTSEHSSGDEEKEQKEMDTTEEDTTKTPVVKSTPKRTRITKSTKRKAATSSSESESDDESTKSQSKQRKLDSRSQRKRGIETPQRGNPTTPQPSPGIARPRKLDVSKKLLILRGSDLKNLSSLKKRVTAAINESKKAANKASPKRPDSDVSRLSGNLTDLDLKLLTDESISTGTVTLIDSTSQSNKRHFRDTEEYDEFKEFRDGSMIHIDIPNVRIIDEKPVGPPFQRTLEYIKYEDPDRYDRSTLILNPIPAVADFDTYSHRKIDISVEYNIESEDEEWLNKYNKESRYPLSEKDFESIIALMNRASKNGKSCWFSVASVIELSRFFDVKLEERHIVQVKKLWESKYNPQHKLFKNEDLQKGVENENVLYEYMCVKQLLNTYKERVEQIMGISEQKKDLLDKHLKQMKRKNYSVTKDFPKFVTKYSKLIYDDGEEMETNSEEDESGDTSNKLEEEQAPKDSFPADQVEIELFIAEEKKEEERQKSNTTVGKLWKKGENDLEEQHDESTLESTEFNSSSNEPYSPPSSVPSSLASLIIPPLPPILTKNLSNIQTPENTPTNVDTPNSAVSNSDDLHSTKRRTRKKRMDCGTPTSNVSRTPTSASNMDFQQSFDESSSLISSPTPTDIVPPLLEASSPLPSPTNNNSAIMRRRKKRSKTVIN